MDIISFLETDRRQHFGEATVKSFMRQIFTSLDHMHGKGVFHRDIKVCLHDVLPSVLSSFSYANNLVVNAIISQRTYSSTSMESI